MIWICGALAVAVAAGLAQALAGWVLTARFARAAATNVGVVAPTATAPIAVLKPLHGAEPLLFEALSTLCEQDYPPGFQIVFGVGAADDAAILAVEALRARYEACDIALVVDGTRHGRNPKVGNLINMLHAARHDIVAIADFDVHVRPGYLRSLAAALDRPEVGLVTTLYAGLPAAPCLASALGATQISFGFLPSALLARALGRRDCLGATMALRRETLAAIGGLESLKDHLADDNVLGQRVRALGLDVALADTVVATTVPEATLRALWRHEARWARTIRTLEPAGFAASLIQYPVFWAMLALLASGGAYWAWCLAVAAWIVRAMAVAGMAHAMRPLLEGLAFPAPLWLLPLRDVLSAAVWVAGLTGRRVEWRGLTLQADTPPRLPQPGLHKGSNTR